LIGSKLSKKNLKTNKAIIETIDQEFGSIREMSQKDQDEIKQLKEKIEENKKEIQELVEVVRGRYTNLCCR
jgi:peptidoglycan hydrolase CwlO-like protein